jgi:predicted dehydrogenase
VKLAARPPRVGVLGAGTWGRNYVRSLAALPEAELTWVCDLAEEARRRAGLLAPGVRLTARLEEMLADPALEAVVIASNAVHHHAHAAAALRAGKHVLVEKPMTVTVADAEELCRLAKQSGRTLMVGHLMLYHGAVERLRAMVAGGELGRIYYLYAVRVNLGRIRRDENALWSFAPHDLSIILSLLEAEPESVAARGECYLQPGVEDVVFLNLRFADGTMAQIQLSWLDPRKERRLTVVGSKKMVVFDDGHPTEKLRVYDKGFDQPPEFTTFGEYLSIRDGDIHIPHLELGEPLRAECQHFLRCVAYGEPPRTSGEEGLRVVRLLAAAEQSMRQGGVPVRLG